ncbi:YXWGXW repeat-containing protein [Acidicapsa acidisoli]|uniref:YXWGXW repeat-containing protein n=1 Tax=Acidicapsa acidisoli TaxID=1615681 RepID=UPI0021E0A350|nr:hypothetical protein [Acidicapsa acidisoli]
MKVFRSARLFFLAALLCLVPASSFAGVFISIGIAPPVLPVYVQPPCPYDGYMWTPGYWAYGDDGYYWVPGAWVPVPTPGYLWTPPYWGFEGGHYLFHEGYWGPHIGYYGGVNYGFGYMGVGFAGGEWRGGHFFYNTAIVHVGGGFHNTYVNETIVHNTTVINNNHVAYSGGPGGIQHQPTAEERTAMSERHVAPTAAQQQHIAAAAHDPQQHFNANHGHPATVAAARPMTAPAHTQSAMQNHPAQAARPAMGNTPQAHTQMAPANQSRPAAESRPAPAAHTAPAARPQMESRPAPAAQSRPAPQSHSEPQSRPAPKPSGGEKPHGHGR